MSRTRRLVVALTASVAVLGLLGAAVWFVLLPNWRPPLRAGERFGIDVSSHQAAIQWQRVAGDEIRFVYIKATEGSDFTPPITSRRSTAGPAGRLPRCL